MSARPRDLLKTRPQRLGEVLSNVHLKSGQADSQTILWGCALGTWTDADEFKIAVGEVVLAGAIVAVPAATDIEVDAGAATGAGEFRKVLVEVNASGVVSQVVGDKASLQANAVLPAGDVAKISVGYIEIPASFTPGTTAVTSGMLKAVAYHA